MSAMLLAACITQQITAEPMGSFAKGLADIAAQTSKVDGERAISDYFKNLKEENIGDLIIASKNGIDRYQKEIRPKIIQNIDTINPNMILVLEGRTMSAINPQMQMTQESMRIPILGLAVLYNDEELTKILLSKNANPDTLILHISTILSNGTKTTSKMPPVFYALEHIHSLSDPSKKPTDIATRLLQKMSKKNLDRIRLTEGASGKTNETIDLWSYASKLKPRSDTVTQLEDIKKLLSL